MSRAAGALGYVGSTPPKGVLETKATLHSYVAGKRPEAHRGHRCCIDPGRVGGVRFSLVGQRAVLQGAVPTAAGRAQGIGRPTAAVVVAARCKSYGCPCCATVNIRRNRKRAALGTSEGSGIVAMATATLDPKHELYRQALDRAPALMFGVREAKVRTLAEGAESAASVRFIGTAWNAWITKVRRYEPSWLCDCRRVVVRDGVRTVARRHARGCTVRNRPFAGMAFFKGLELQRSGRAHLHVLLRVPDLEALFLMQGALRGMADSVGFGGKRRWQDGKGRLRSGFEIERVRGKLEAARYVSKVAGSWYGRIAGEVAKERQQRTLPAYARRASWSMGRRAWTTRWRDVRRGDLEWSFARWDPSTLSRALEASGVMVGRHLVPTTSEEVQRWTSQSTA